MILLLGMPSGWEWIVVLLAVLLLFGGAKLPQLAKALGQSKRAFKEGLDEGAREEIPAAEKEKAEMQGLMTNEGLTIPIKPFSPVIEGARSAEALLSGFIYVKQNNIADAIIHLQKATEIESKMTYAEPRDWMLSPKQYLGSAYLVAKKYSEAQKTFASDLKVNADNVWSLYGLEQSLVKQKKQTEATKIKNKLTKALVGSDTKPGIML